MACGQLSIAEANSSSCFIVRPSHLAKTAWSSNNSTSPDSDKTFASPFSPKKRSWKLRSLADTGVSCSALALHHCPGDTAQKLSNLRARRWRCRRRRIVSGQTNLLPWRGRVGARGVGQTRPSLPPPRRLEGVLPSCNKRGNRTQHNPENQTLVYPNSSIGSCLQSITLFYSFLTSVIPYPTSFALLSPGRACCDKAQ